MTGRAKVIELPVDEWVAKALDWCARAGHPDPVEAVEWALFQAAERIHAEDAAVRRAVDRAATAEVVPPGVRLLPIVSARPAAEDVPVSAEGGIPAPVSEDEYDVSEDELTERARREYADTLTAGRTPSIRALRAAYSIGQPRAQRIKRALG